MEGNCMKIKVLTISEIRKIVSIFKNANSFQCFVWRLTFQIKSANKIVIVGGGAVGVELAGEIATEFPGKQLTLIHDSKRGLIEGKEFSDKFRKNILSQLEKLKVNVLLGRYCHIKRPTQVTIVTHTWALYTDKNQYT